MVVEVNESENAQAQQRRAAEPLVSVIVPVYKVEKSLNRCVESIVGQTYFNMEIILVDDGSPDNSGELCDEWASRDSRIRVIHKANGGLSDARNVGAAAAKGVYVCFVDSDDYVARDFCEALVRLMRENDAELAICGVADVYADHTDVPSEQDVRVLTPEETLSDIFLNRTLMVGVPPRMYPAWLAKEVQEPVGKTHEDSFVVVDFISRVNKVVVDTKPRYYYCHNEGTITSTPKTRARLDLIEAWERNRQLVEEKYPAILPDVMFRCYWAHFDVLDGIMLSGIDDPAKDDIVAYLREHRDDILAHPAVSWRRKFGLRLLLANEGMYRALVRAQNRHIHYN